MCKSRSIYPSNGDCTTRYSETVQQGKKPWATGTSALYHVVQLALRDLPEGPRRGCTVPWRTLRVVRGTVKNAGPDMRDGGNDVNDPQRSSGLNNRNRANAFSRQATQLIDSKSRAVAIGGSGLTRRQTKRNLCRTQSVAPHRQRWSRHRSICVLEKSSDEHFC